MNKRILGWGGNYLYRDADGNPVERTKQTHPYSYEMYVLLGKFNDELENNYITGSAYSDRMSQWDYEKNEKAKEKAFGNTGDYFTNRGFNEIEKYLRIYFEDETLELVRVQEGCNVSNGYPLWLFEWHTEKDSND